VKVALTSFPGDGVTETERKKIKKTKRTPASRK